MRRRSINSCNLAVQNDAALASAGAATVRNASIDVSRARFQRLQPQRSYRCIKCPIAYSFTAAFAFADALISRSDFWRARGRKQIAAAQAPERFLHSCRHVKRWCTDPVREAAGRRGHATCAAAAVIVQQDAEIEV